MTDRQPRGPVDWARQQAAERETQGAAGDLQARITAAIRDTPARYPDDIAAAVWRVVQAELAGHYQHAVDAAVAAEQRAKKAEAIVDRMRATRERIAHAPGWVDAIWCLDLLEEALDEPAPAPAATQATDDACCGKPAGAICVHDVTAPAHNAGPSIREAAANDRLWPLEKEGQ